MCECLCGEIQGTFNFRVKGTEPVVSIDVYPGCQECEQLIGVDIRLFTKAGAQEWLDGREIIDAEPDEYGNLPTLKSIPIVSVDALREASRDLPDMEGYASLDDWLEEHGLALLQSAVRSTMEASNG